MVIENTESATESADDPVHSCTQSADKKTLWFSVTAQDESGNMLSAPFVRDLGDINAPSFSWSLSNDGGPFVLEANTIPGMTEASLLPEAAAVAGSNYPELCVRIIELSQRKKEDVD